MVYIESAVRRGQLISAAHRVLLRDGVAGTTMRAVAAEAHVPLGTMQYVFPSKTRLLRSVIEDMVSEISARLEAVAPLHAGLEHAIIGGLRTFWDQLVDTHAELQLAQYELTTYALRTGGEEDLARWQYERYCGIVSDWCERAATSAGETCAVPYDRLGRLAVAGLDGLILQHLVEPDPARSAEDLADLTGMLIALANPTRRD